MPKPRHVHEIYIRTTPARLWAALTEPADTTQYYFGCRYAAPLEVGRPYLMVGEFGDALDGTVVAMVVPERLVVTFHVLFDDEAEAESPTTVTWEITEVTPGVCRLTLVHEDFGGLSKTWSITRTGWRVILDGLKTWVETDQPIGEIPDDRAEAVVPVDLTGEEHRDRGIEIYNETWGYIEMETRSVEDDEAMIRAAYAAAYHWSHAAGRTIANTARSEWQLSRVHVLAGRGETALHHARRCHAVCVEGGLEDFDLAYAHEAMARSLALLGRTDEATRELGRARRVAVGDPEDRRLVELDLATGPWFGLEISTG